MKNFNHHSGQYYSIDDAKIYYETTGNESKPALLFLHGGFGNIEDFNTIISLLKNDYRIIGIDSRGQGKSTLGNVKLSYEIIQKDIEAILKHLEIETLNIIGISDGGIVAYRLACFSELKIKKLITIGSPWHSSNVAATKDVLQKVTVDFWKEKHAETVEIYEKLNPSPDFEKLTPLIVNMWLNEASYPNEQIKNIRCDTLIIRGDKDNLTKRKFVFELANLIPNSNLLNIPFANHVVYTEQPEILMRSINEFMGFGSS
jgi:pimeloyl-ACP methyl ester carboxylesterase